jgi:hypothetical protein
MNYVYTAPSLSKEICEHIIHRYDAERHLKYQGVTASGLDKTIKDTQDMMIPETDKWGDINQLLSKELQRHMKLYMESIETGEHYKKENNYGKEYHHLEEKLIQVNNFMIQRYEQNKGKYVYHHDSSNESKQSRAVTYLWYLNDVTEGGETDFFGGSFQVKPETGKLLLFPACWSYPHRGTMPISSSKYIVTGWLYTENRKVEVRIPRIAPCEPRKDRATIQEENESIPDMDSITEEQKLIFDYFYKSNRFLFLDYKHRKHHESRLVPFMIPTYTRLMTDWMKRKLQEVNGRTSLDNLDTIKPFVISSLNILVDQIKQHLQIECHFNIKEWYVLCNETEPFDLVYDICIQSDLNTGDSHVSRQYKKIEGYQLVYFIEFNFHYVNKEDETKILFLKEIAEPCLELI